MKQKLVFFVGTAGTGKSYLSKRLSSHFSWSYIDMDTVGTRFINQMLIMNGQDPNDRDSSFYKEHLRDLPYQATMDIALENLDSNQHVALIGPFTKELATPNWIEETLEQKGFTLNDVDVKVIIVEVQNAEVEKQRIESRGTERDEWKLQNWDEYKSVKKEFTVSWNIPSSSVLYFDNSGTLTDDKLQGLIDFISN